MAMKHPSAKHNEHSRGSVLVYILIAVALFAALGYAVSSMMRSSGESIGSEKAGVVAAEILGYAGQIRETIQALRISNNCGNEQLSFERSPFDGSDTDYQNTDAPVDKTCHVFHPNGGGLSPSPPSSEASNGQDWIFSGDNTIPELGDDASPELIMILSGLPQSLCLKINDIVGITNPSGDAPLDTDGFSTEKFNGSYTQDGEIGSSLEFGGKLAGCFKDTKAEPDTYNFYQVLIAR